MNPKPEPGSSTASGALADRPPVVVVGGGISGLAAAWQLKRDGVPVRLLEASDRVGGKIVTTEFLGRRVDEAADAFLARVPHGIELANELGLGDELIEPGARKAQVWTPIGLQRLPEPHALGIPLDPGAVEAMLGAEAGRAVAADLARTEPDPVRPDDTIGSLVRRRLGDRIHEVLVDPLIGSINAGDTDQLDLAASQPQILAAAQAGPSLAGSFQKLAASRRVDAPVFHAFEGGMATLTDALAEALSDIITVEADVTAIRSSGLAPAANLVIEVADGPNVAASAVVLATPAPVAARLVAASFGDAANLLHQTPMASVTMVALAYPANTVGADSDLSGFVVPRSDPSLTITACSYATHKWPHLVEPSEPDSPSSAEAGPIDLLRVSVGHTGDSVTPALADSEIVRIVLDDLRTAIGLQAEPLAHRITRWPASFPQYTAGHLDRLAQAEGILNPAGVFLSGMSYRGIGIPANIDAGRSAAVSAVLFLLD